MGIVWVARVLSVVLLVRLLNAAVSCMTILNVVLLAVAKSVVLSNERHNNIMYTIVNDITIDFLTSPVLNLVPKLNFEDNARYSGIIKASIPRITVMRSLYSYIVCGPIFTFTSVVHATQTPHPSTEPDNILLFLHTIRNPEYAYPRLFVHVTIEPYQHPESGYAASALFTYMWNALFGASRATCHVSHQQ